MDLTEQLIGEEEGRERCAYPDSVHQYLTIGIGCLVDKRVKGAGLCDAAIDAQFAHDSANCRATAARIPNYDKLNPTQQAALNSVCFQLGAAVLGWKGFMAAMGAGDYGSAANALMDSTWAKEQTPQRAERETKMLATGVWVPHG